MKPSSDTHRWRLSPDSGFTSPDSEGEISDWDFDEDDIGYSVKADRFVRVLGRFFADRGTAVFEFWTSAPLDMEDFLAAAHKQGIEVEVMPDGAVCGPLTTDAVDLWPARNTEFLRISVNGAEKILIDCDATSTLATVDREEREGLLAALRGAGFKPPDAPV